MRNTALRALRIAGPTAFLAVAVSLATGAAQERIGFAGPLNEAVCFAAASLASLVLLAAALSRDSG